MGQISPEDTVVNDQIRENSFPHAFEFQREADQHKETHLKMCVRRWDMSLNKHLLKMNKG